MTSKSDSQSRFFVEPGVDERSDNSHGLNQSEIFHILQTNRRRDVIAYLLNEDGPVKMRDIAEIIAADEHDTTVGELTSVQRQRVYIPLYQTHLPKLDTKRIIEYDKARGIVRPAERLETFRPYLDVAKSRGDRGSPKRSSDRSHFADAFNRYYVAATAANTGLIVTSAAGLLSLPGTTLAAITTSLFVLAVGATAIADSSAREATEDGSATTLRYRE